ncbi:MaoC/PaaZ C-terminal domain-containing protein [Sphingomonas jaspsi]|uniref:MaoC/PaaZ C-terminal domain-containing protein n=1 Tax=Sphingomonas jaspsi TaxID=392409 RepID=UPI0004B7D374|nr:MaoC/PaaZ C-terminal domain-containing protein [Sphingomonas jaspsi]
MHERPPRKFEDLAVGETRESGWREISEQEIVDFARQYDPQWFHTDPEAAKASTFGQVVASGVQLLAIWRQLDHGINSDIDFVCGVGFDDYRMKTALRAGDRVKVRSEILELHPSTRRTDRGTAITAYEMVNDRGDTILSFKSINLVHRRGS